MKNILTLITLVLGITTFFSCNKTDNLIDDIVNDSTNSKTLTVGDFLDNSSDTLDQRVNYCLYDIALALREDLLNNTILVDLINVADSNNGEVNLYDFFNDHTALKDSFKYRLAQITGNDPETFNYEDYIRVHLTYDTVYQPYITIVNMDTLNQNLTPYICVGAQINEDNWPGYEDNILKMTKVGGEWSISAIGETEATTSSHPVLVINNGLSESGVDLDKIAVDVSNKTNSTARYYQDEIQLNFAYEKSGKIDYRIYTAYYFHGYTYELRALFSKKKINRCDIGKKIVLSFEVTPFSDAMKINNCNTTLINIEYDWYASKKLVGKICHPIGGTQQFKSSIKYKKEWYHFKPTNIGFDFPQHLPQNGSQYVQSNQKGYIKLSRIDN